MLKEMLRNLRVYWMGIILSHDHLLEPQRMEVDASNDAPGHKNQSMIFQKSPGRIWQPRSLEGKKLKEF